jgi:hypothetical protein
MVRRTVSLPESTDALVRELATDGESFSAAVTRLIETGAAASRAGSRLGYIGSGEGPGDEIGLKADEIVREVIAEHERKERPQG